MSLATASAMSPMNIRQTELAKNYGGATPISAALDKERRELSLKGLSRSREIPDPDDEENQLMAQTIRSQVLLHTFVPRWTVADKAEDSGHVNCVIAFLVNPA